MIMLIGVSLLLCVGKSFADTLPSSLIGAEIELATTTITTNGVSTGTSGIGTVQEWALIDEKVNLHSSRLVGYIEWSPYDKNLNVASLDALETLRSAKTFCFFIAADWFAVKNPVSLLVSTTATTCLFLHADNVVRVRPWAGPLSGSLGGYSGIDYLPPEQGNLLKDGEPFYSCRNAQNSLLIWMSYNRKIGEKELSEFCSGEIPRGDKVKRMMTNPGVFPIALEDDD